MRSDQVTEHGRMLKRAAVAAAGLSIAIAGGASAASNGSAAAPPSGAAAPTVVITSPRNGGSYQRGSQIRARFSCTENGTNSTITRCQGTASNGHLVSTQPAGGKNFTVTATDATGATVTRTFDYTVWSYVNPLHAVAALRTSRIDMGVDYSGAGPILAIGKAKIIFANNKVGGPESCWGKTCAPPGSGMVVYRLLDGPLIGKYVYAVEAVTVSVKAGQVVKAGQKIATLHDVSPNLEIGWAAGHGPETLAVKDGHQCTCADPGGWSTVEGRNFDKLLVWLGAPGGYLQSVPNQRMPRGWPGLPARHRA
jgi:murein DD-endopeptidase MepM/ murein hydrolase activator NlpD